MGSLLQVMGASLGRNLDEPQRQSDRHLVTAAKSLNVGTWNVRSLFNLGQLENIIEGMDNSGKIPQQIVYFYSIAKEMRLPELQQLQITYPNDPHYKNYTACNNDKNRAENLR